MVNVYTVHSVVILTVSATLVQGASSNPKATIIERLSSERASKLTVYVESVNNSMFCLRLTSQGLPATATSAVNTPLTMLSAIPSVPPQPALLLKSEF